MSVTQKTLVMISAALLLWIFARSAFGWTDPRTEVLAGAIQGWQPRAGEERANHLAEIILRHARVNEFPAWILAAIIAKESRFRRDIESRRLRGALGEIGLAQIHPSMLALGTPAGCLRSLPCADCQIGAGAILGAFSRQQCPGPWPRWVAAYGMSRCPSIRQARSTRSVRNVTRLLREAGVSTEEETWR